MKKNLFLVAAVALAAVVSCNKEGLGDNDGAQTPSSVVFTAGVETKTTLVDNGDKTYSINWISGDAISVDGVTFTTTDSGAKAFFLTEDAFTEDNDYEAIYPATAGSSFASVTVPQSQEATAGNFCSSAAVSVAKSNTTSLDFKNLTSFLKFQVPANANTITISSIDDLAGEVTVNYNNGEPTWTAKNTVKSIKVTCSGGFKTGQDYYVSVLPGVKKNFEVRIDGYLSKSKESVEPKRSTVMKMGVLPAPVVQLERGLSFSDASVSVTYGDAFTAPTLSGETTGVVYTSSNPSVATVNPETGEVTLVAGGETTITATADATETLKAGTASYTLIVAKAQRNLAFSKTSATADTRFGLTAAPTLSGVIDNVTYTSSKTSVATVAADGKVTINGVGTATITASAPATNIYTSGTATYKLTVEQGKIKIYVYLYPKENGWTEWMNRNPYIHYFDSQTISKTQWPGVEMTLQEEYEGKTRYYYEFNYHTKDKISVVINNNNNSNFKQTVDVADLALDTDHSLEVWTDWESDGKLKVGILK